MELRIMPVSEMPCVAKTFVRNMLESPTKDVGLSCCWCPSFKGNQRFISTQTIHWTVKPFTGLRSHKRIHNNTASTVLSEVGFQVSSRLPKNEVDKIIAASNKDEESDVTATRKNIFNSIAPMYDQLNDLLSLGQHRVWKRMTVNWSRAKPGHAVLDICCGSGDIAFLLADRVGQEGKVTGLDFAAEQLTVAAKRQNESFHASRVDMSWIEGNALSLPFPNEEFDAITMGYGLRNVADIPKSLSEIHRVLKSGSWAAILDFNNSTDMLTSTFQAFMLDNLVVPVATQLGMAAEYEYLKPSIQRFPTGRQQIKLAKAAAFQSATHYELAGGLMGVLVLQK